ncbi:MAG: hypothetical protein Q8N90_03915 [bacterium]|nr:hypothetical protein [bacterium]
MRKLFQNQWVIMSASISGALILLILGFLFFNIQSTDRPYIIHYKAIGGIDLFGSWRNLYVLGLVAILVLLFHLFLAKILWEKIRELSYFLLFSAPLLEIIILIATINIIRINY